MGTERTPARNVSHKPRIISSMADKQAAPGNSMGNSLGNPLAAAGAASVKHESKGRKGRVQSENQINPSAPAANAGLASRSRPDGVPKK